MRLLPLVLCLSVFAFAGARQPRRRQQQQQQQRSLSSLKQTTRNEIVKRASRPQTAKRATISGGGIPSSSNQRTFVIQAKNSNNQNVEDKYAENTSGYNFAEFKTATTANAATYYIDSAGYLHNTNENYIAWADPSSDPGLSLIYFVPAGSEDDGAVNVKCTVSPSSILTCTLDMPNPPAYSQGICQPSSTAGLGFNFGGSTTCIPADIMAYEATP